MTNQNNKEWDELEKFLGTLNIHHKGLKKIKLCFNDALAAGKIKRLFDEGIKKERQRICEELEGVESRHPRKGLARLYLDGWKNGRDNLKEILTKAIQKING